MRSLSDTFATRAALAILGGYLFASGVAACIALVLAAVGVPRDGAAQTAALAQVLVYAGAGLGCFADLSVRSLAAVTVGGGAVLLGIARLAA